MKIKSDFYGTRRLFFHYLDDALREMTNKEKLRAENKMLETKIKEWEMENTYLIGI